MERIQPDQIDVIICAEFPDHEADPDLHDVVITNTIYGQYSKEISKLRKFWFRKCWWSQPICHLSLKYFNFRCFFIRILIVMTINKSEGKYLKFCGLNLEYACFSRGQLYVSCSRIGRPSALFVYAPDNKTKNIVYLFALNGTEFAGSSSSPISSECVSSQARSSRTWHERIVLITMIVPWYEIR